MEGDCEPEKTIFIDTPPDKPPPDTPPSDNGIPQAPDGGYGWVIVIASFLMGLIVDGCLFTFGIMTMEFVDYYQTNKMTIAWAGSVMNGVYLTVGESVSRSSLQSNPRTKKNAIISSQSQISRGSKVDLTKPQHSRFSGPSIYQTCLHFAFFC